MKMGFAKSTLAIRELNVEVRRFAEKEAGMKASATGKKEERRECA